MAQTANSNTISRFKGKPKTKIKLVDIQVGWTERCGAYTTATAKCCGRKSRQPLPVSQVMGAVDQPRIELSQNDDIAQQAKEQQNEQQTTSSSSSSSSSSPLELSCIREVELNFLNLVSYNKLQLFYIGTLIYSVMNIAFIFYYYSKIVPNNTEGKSATTKLLPVQQEEKSNYLTQATHSPPLQPPDHLYYLDPKAARFLLAALLPLTLLLGLIAAITALRFAQKLSTWLVVAAWQRRPPRRKRKSERVEEEKNVSERWSEEDTTATLQTLGLILSLLLLYLPLLPLPAHLPGAAAQLDQDQLTRPLSGRQVNGGSSNGSAVEAFSLATNLPLAATLTLIYLTPHLLDGARLFVCLTALLPLALFALLRIATPLLNHFQRAPSERHLSLNGDYSDYEYLSVLFATALPLTIAFGLLKRSQWSRSLSRDTFAGASELIEAKVSLEHQRQQQETLLLSVLPAYVAEQVKRNMLKKTNTVLVQQQQQQPSCASTASVSNTVSPTNNQQQPEAVTVLSTPLAGNHFRTSECDDPLSRKWPLRNSSGQQRLHPSLVSGVSVDTTHSFSAAITPLIKTNSLSHTNLPQQVNHHHQHSVALNTGSAGGTGGAVGSSNNRRGFNELYIRTYNNVSLLYGDIVGFTRLCTQLSSSQLVRVLNDLFSHFDYLAEKHKIMRIKILGDCYYGVGGIPEFAVMGAKSRASSRHDNHAINCVNMGLDMIHYIRCLNIERASCASNEQQQQQQQQHLNQLSSGHNTPLPQFELNMRIGVHTGHIHSGVIGLKKWQFDVWSNDVSIAMHSESSGIPGRVQVTEATLTQLNGAFTYESAPGCLSDSFLCANDIRTYLIRDRVLRSNHLPTHLQQPQVCTLEKKRAAAAVAASSSAREVEPRDEDNIRAATIGTIRQTLLAADNSSSGWQGSGNASSTGGFNHHDLTWLTLTYRDAAMRKLHRQQPIAHLLKELLRLQLLVGVCLPLIFLYNKTSTTTESLSMPLATCVLILVLVSIFARNSSDEISATTTTTKASATVGAGGGHLTVDRKKRKWMSSIEVKLAKPFTCLAFLTPVRQRSAIRSLSVTLLLMAVIIVQLLLVAKRTCGGANKWLSQQQVSYITNTKPPDLQQVSLLSEQYQLTVILLLISIDSSVHLLSYKIKCCLLMGSLCIHLLLMLQPTTLLHYTICRLQVTTPIEVEHQQQQQQQQQRDELSLNLNQQVVLIAAATAANQSLIEWSSNLMILLLVLCSFGFARQLDYNNKTSFLWRNRLSVDHEELEYISSINKLLLENILPSHVVQYYLTQPATGCSSNSQLPNVQSYMRMSFSNMRTMNNELYHEQHEHVAVMFASIPHFYEFYDESDISKQGLGCIALLNEIICDFDKLLLKNKFSRIEKIKTIGSTYMAAAGLRPCYLSASRGSSASNQSTTNHQHRPSTGATGGVFHPQQVGSRLRTTQSARIAATSSTGANAAAAAAAHLLLCEHDERKLALSQQKLNLICMIQFASSLMTALNGINKQSFQVFKLRIGVNTGSVIAGVIGAQRPFYDIWGDCVNIASRMESLGEVGRIQVEEKTAKLLMENLCADTYSIVKRGPIDVKGKGGMLTYFVDKKNMSNNNNNNTTTAESSVPATSATGKQ